MQQHGTDENRFEREGDEFYGRIHQAYEQIAERETERVVVIRDDAPIEAIQARIEQVVRERMGLVLDSAKQAQVLAQQ